MRTRKLARLLGFIVVSAGVITILWQLQLCATAPDIEKGLNHFRIVGEVEFEGERISYNEIIQVRVKLGSVSTMGLKKGDNRVV